MERVEEYKEKRKSFAQKWEGRQLFEYIDQWPLYVGTKNLARFLAISDLFREVLDVPGDIAEFGSWKGSNVIYMAKLLEIFRPLSTKKVHCFEGFEGLGTFVEKDGGGSEKYRGEYKGSQAELEDITGLYRLDHRVVIHKGLIQETVPQFMSHESWRRFSFIYFDADLYDPAMIVLNNFYDMLSVGGMIIFDEWNDARFPGETRAVTEYFDKRTDYKLISPSHTHQPSLVIKKTLQQSEQ